MNIFQEDILFQQDGAMLHSANDTNDLLRQRFRGRIISRNGDVNWSCHLNPFDYFPQSHEKSQVNENSPKSIPVLKDEIIRFISVLEL